MLDALELLDMLPVAVAISRPDGYMTYVNLACVALVGAEGPHDLVGHYVVEFVHPADAGRATDSRQRIISGGMSPPQNRYRIRRLNGSDGYVEVYSLLLDPDGDTSVLSAMLDVSDQLEAERERQAAEERYRALVEAAPDGIAVQVDGRYVYANPEFLRMLGAASVGQIIGMPIMETVAPHDRDRSRESIENTMRSGLGPSRHRYEMLGLDGRRTAVEVTARRVEFDGHAATQAIFRPLPAKD